MQPERAFRYMNKKNEVATRIARIAQFGEGLVEVWSVHVLQPGGRVVYHVDVPARSRVERHETRAAALAAGMAAFFALGGAS